MKGDAEWDSVTAKVAGTEPNYKSMVVTCHIATIADRPGCRVAAQVNPQTCVWEGGRVAAQVNVQVCTLGCRLVSVSMQGGETGSH
eukprot:136957-Chlamydomonas_euryale.AAC.1